MHMKSLFDMLQDILRLGHFVLLLLLLLDPWGVVEEIMGFDT